jgi:hypothetical protein
MPAARALARFLQLTIQGTKSLFLLYFLALIETMQMGNFSRQKNIEIANKW